MTELPDDIARVLGHVYATIGEREQWAQWPGGWPDDIESALVDAIFSARAVYRSERLSTASTQALLPGSTRGTAATTL